MRIDMRIDTCIDTCIDMCIYMCIDIREPVTHCRQSKKSRWTCEYVVEFS